MAKVRGGAKFKSFMRNAHKAQSKSKKTDVGFFATARYPPMRAGKNGGQKQHPHYVATVAAWLEFGTSRGLKERPFFRNAIDGADEDLVPVLKESLAPGQMEIDEKTARRLGEVMKARVQRSITVLKEPANRPSTVARKGSSNPLIDTGVLRQSVDYEVS